MNAREIVLDMLLGILEEKKLSHYVIKDGLSRHKELEKTDRAFISRLTTGCVERMITLDYDINKFSKVKVHKMKPVIRNILRMGVYQIKFMDQIPDSAVCNEAVKLAKKRGFTGLSGFVNGTLRSMAREKEKLNAAPAHLNEQESMSYEYSMPLWIVTDLCEAYGADKTKEILTAYLLPKRMTVRLNTSKMPASEIEAMLTKEQVKFLPGRMVPDARILEGYDSLERMDSFAKGYYQVQDESSMLVGLISGIKTGDYVIDVCSAPGGKTLHAAELLQGKGHVDARDKTESKTALINENVKRCGYDNVSVKAWDALVLDTDSVGKADVVIADLPCSGLGVIGKKSDIKYNMTKEMMHELALLQQEILKVVTKYVKEDGILIYSTCTINKEENEKNVDFLTKELGFVLEPIDSLLPKAVCSETASKGYQQILPSDCNTDGFFVARLRKPNGQN